MPSSKSESGEWLTTEQVMAYLAISRTAATRLKRRIPWSKAPGIGVRFRRSDIDAYLLACQRSPTASAGLPVWSGTPVASGGDDEIVPGTAMTRAELRAKVGWTR